MMTKFFVAWTYVVALWANLIAPCAFNPNNWEYCTKDLDVWLYPELQRAWGIITEAEVPYQEEQELLGD